MREYFISLNNNNVDKFAFIVKNDIAETILKLGYEIYWNERFKEFPLRKRTIIRANYIIYDPSKRENFLSFVY